MYAVVLDIERLYKTIIRLVYAIMTCRLFFIMVPLIQVLSLAIPFNPHRVPRPQHLCLSGFDKISECTFTTLNSTDVETYMATVLTGTIPIVDDHMDLRNISYWLDSTLLRSSSVPVLDHTTIIMNNEIQRRILRFRFPYPLPPRTNPLRVFVAILSRTNACLKRESIRSTWLRKLDELKGFVIVYKFFVGMGAIESCQDERDVISLPIPDEYRNLTTKMSLLFNHIINKQRRAFDVLLKLDDDVYVRPFPVLNHLNSFASTNYIWGSFVHTSAPVRDPTDHAHYISPETYPPQDSFFPLYPRGFAYAISWDLMNRVMRQRDKDAAELNFPFEDVALGYTIARLQEKSVVMDDRSELHFSRIPSCEQGIESGISSSSWIIHHLNESQISCMYDHDLKNQHICACV